MNKMKVNPLLSIIPIIGIFHVIKVIVHEGLSAPIFDNWVMLFIAASIQASTISVLTTLVPKLI